MPHAAGASRALRLHVWRCAHSIGENAAQPPCVSARLTIRRGPRYPRGRYPLAGGLHLRRGVRRSCDARPLAGAPLASGRDAPCYPTCRYPLEGDGRLRRGAGLPHDARPSSVAPVANGRDAGCCPRDRCPLAGGGRDSGRGILDNGSSDGRSSSQTHRRGRLRRSCNLAPRHTRRVRAGRQTTRWV
jgi:hypothetical protein